ncbi:kinase-like domain-containing protein [Nemania serpens]|nr:kinase-like domain-containing protein [Nemania serpens]
MPENGFDDDTSQSDLSELSERSFSDYDLIDLTKYDLPGNGLILEGSPTGLEKLYDYEPGGHHPLHLGAILHDRYRVIHKLGSRGYANVWLCCDNNSSKPRYVAVKIIMAEGSTPACPELRVNKLIDMGIAAEDAARHFCLPLNQFSINGPNGTHHALVYPVLGPRVSRLFSKLNDNDLDDILRKIAAQVTQAMSTLHTHGICHGDFRPANILARISNLDGLSEDEIFRLVGESRQIRVTTAAREKHDLPTAPQYLVYPIIWDDIAPEPPARCLITGEACIIDFGESFEFANPPPDLGIPQSYCPPEYILDKKVGASCDIWALGCTLFEIRTGRRLFGAFDDDRDEHLCKMAMVLGKLPEPWWAKTWEARSRFLVDEVDADGKVVEVKWDDPTADRAGAVVYQKPEPRSIRESIEEGLFYDFRYKPGGIRKEIPEAEIDLLADLLEKLLKYLPEERLEVADALTHQWFKV